MWVVAQYCYFYWEILLCLRSTTRCERVSSKHSYAKDECESAIHLFCAPGQIAAFSSLFISVILFSVFAVFCHCLPHIAWIPFEACFGMQNITMEWSLHVTLHIEVETSVGGCEPKKEKQRILEWNDEVDKRSIARSCFSLSTAIQLNAILGTN